MAALLQNLIVAVVVATAGGVLALRAWRFFVLGRSGGCGCNSCPVSKQPGSEPTQLVQLKAPSKS